MDVMFQNSAELCELRSRFLFTESGVLERIIEHDYIDPGDYFKQQHGQEKYDAEKLSRALRALQSQLGDVRNRMSSFPLRHRANLAGCVRGNHPAWRGRLDALLSQLGKGSIFALLGPRGTGKTQLVTGLARAVVEKFVADGSKSHNDPAKYAVLGDVFTEIKATFKEGSRSSEDAILSRLSKVGLLVLDECHESGGTEWNVRVLTLLADARYREKLDTILIANLTQGELLAAVGPSIASRMDECGFFITCDWPSFRGNGRATA